MFEEEVLETTLSDVALQNNATLIDTRGGYQSTQDFLAADVVLPFFASSAEDVRGTFSLL